MANEIKKQAEAKSKWTLVQVPTQHTLALSSPEGEVLSIEEAMAAILNKLDKLQEQLIG